MHLRLDPDERDSAPWVEYADVLTASAAVSWETAGGLLDALLDAHPGCLLASVPLRESGGCLLETPGARRLVVLPSGGTPPLTTWWPAVASFLYAWLTLGRPVDALHGASLTLPSATADIRLIRG
ncbi:hypothetical protein ACWGIB_14270 [Streptomyces xiamenensis]